LTGRMGQPGPPFVGARDHGSLAASFPMNGPAA
jgi:hypothetical protein